MAGSFPFVPFISYTFLAFCCAPNYYIIKASPSRFHVWSLDYFQILWLYVLSGFSLYAFLAQKCFCIMSTISLGFVGSAVDILGKSLRTVSPKPYLLHLLKFYYCICFKSTAQIYYCCPTFCRFYVCILSALLNRRQMYCMCRHKWLIRQIMILIRKKKSTHGLEWWVCEKMIVFYYYIHYLAFFVDCLKIIKDTNT